MVVRHTILTTSIADRATALVSTPQGSNSGSAILAREDKTGSIRIDTLMNVGYRWSWTIVILWSMGAINIVISNIRLRYIRRRLHDSNLRGFRNTIVVSWTTIAAVSTSGAIAMPPTWTGACGYLPCRHVCGSTLLCCTIASQRR